MISPARNISGETDAIAMEFATHWTMIKMFSAYP